MSTALAIAATTKVLTSLLDAYVNIANLSGVLEVPVTSALPPDRVISGEGEKPHLNLFLYRVSFNQGWRDAGLPSVDPQGNRVSRPKLALDLHYMLSAYADVDYQAEMLLGLGMQALHENPVLARDEIRSVFVPPPAGATLAEKLVIAMGTAQLADQVELIKICPEEFSTEELSKLWTAFSAKYRPSVGYHASVVLIESTGPFRSTLPVLQRNVYALAWRQPVIAFVEEQMLPFTPGAVIHLDGVNLLLAGAVVRFASGEEQQPDKLKSSNGRLTVPLPTLRAGLNGVQVVSSLQLGSGAPRPIVESNVAAFVLQPTIISSAGTPGSPATVSAKIDPLAFQGQKVTVLLDQLNAPMNVNPLGFSFDLPALTGPPTNTVTTPLPGVPTGKYLLRVRVDGAESPFEFDSTGAFKGPAITI